MSVPDAVQVDGRGTNPMLNQPKTNSSRNITLLLCSLALVACASPEEGSLGMVTPAVNEITLESGTRCVVAKYGANISVACDWKEST